MQSKLPATTNELKGYHTGELLRLSRLLGRRNSFQLILAEYNAPKYRDKLIERLADSSKTVTVAVVDSSVTAGVLLSEWSALAGTNTVIHVIGLNNWLDQQPDRSLNAFNYGRETLAEGVRASLVLWLSSENVKRFAHEAPDLWAWRSAVLNFNLRPSQRDEVHATRIDRRVADLDQRRVRLKAIREHLEKGERRHSDINLLLESADLEEGLGNLKQAQIDADLALMLAQRFDDALAGAEAQSQIADILQARGELDEALRIRREEQLPVYERLGEVREIAITKGQIADILQARGELDEALRIRREEELPVYERLKDMRSLLVGQANMALGLLKRNAPGDRENAGTLLCLAKNAAVRLRIPEAEQIEMILHCEKLDCE